MVNIQYVFELLFLFNKNYEELSHSSSFFFLMFLIWTGHGLDIFQTHSNR